MKEKIERLSKGIMEYELPHICLSVESLNITVEAGKLWEGFFSISNNANRPMKGLVYSSDGLLTFSDSTFYGLDNCITCQFDASHRKAGDRLIGEISIVSDCGEKTLPFEAEIEAPGYASSLGRMKDLFQFANLARMDWSDAKKVFKSEDFERIFLRNEEKYKYLYRNLRKSISTSQALEEFLIAIHKKQPIKLSIDRTRLEYIVTGEEITDKLVLTKDHWGYAEIKVSTDAAFIQLEQKYVWADHFIGNSQQITFTIHPQNMKKMHHYGRIYIKTVHQTLVVEVDCRCSEEKQPLLTAKRQRQKVEYELLENYLKLRMNRISLETYVKSCEELLAQLPTEVSDSNPSVADERRADFVRTHLAIITGNDQTAGQMLESFGEQEKALKKTSVLDYCCYLYLEALYRREEDIIKNATQTIRRYYESGNFDWRILWFLLYTDKRYDKNKEGKLKDIREQFENGCHNPMVYYEAIEVLKEEPYLLRDLSDFEIQVMNFGIRYGLLTKDLVEQYNYLANRRKTFHPVIFRGLCKLYEEYGTTDILSTICCMLIKGYQRSVKFNPWYRLGVEAQLRITELYEYYIYTMDEANMEELAQPVLLYFIYNSNLNDKKKAYLYSNIIYNKKKNEAIYRSYYKKMEVFALKQLEAHNISHSLAALYREFLDPNSLISEMSQHLPYVIFKHELRCDNPNIVGVTVIHREMDVEVNQPLVRGSAMVDIYSSNAEIFLVDSTGNRYETSIEYQLTPLLETEVYAECCIGKSDHPMLLLHMFDRYQKNRIVNERSIALRKQVLFIEGLVEEYRCDCLQILIDFYYENIDDELLEEYLREIKLCHVKPEIRTKLIEYMIIRSHYDRAIELIREYGFEKIGVNRLLKLSCGCMANPTLSNNKELLLQLCYYVFQKGKYNEAILQYLIHNYYGPIKEMLGLWQASKDFELMAHNLEEKLISQMLFAESNHSDSFLVFQEYYRDITNRTLVRAFLSYHAYKYLVHDRMIHPGLFAIMRRELNYEENDICLLAWLKFNSSNRELSEHDLSFAAFHMGRLEKKGILLSFFADYSDRIDKSRRLLHKCYVEYRTDPRKQVYLHYRFIKEDALEEYITERMPNIFMGIHSKEFTLFYHEILQYYITEEFEGEETITESRHLKMEQEILEEESNYNQINLMLMSMEMKDEQALLQTMEHYVSNQYMISKCFQMLK